MPAPTLAPLRLCALRPRARVSFRPVVALRGAGAAPRTYADGKNDTGRLPKAPPGEAGPNMQQAEHVSEEAAKMAEIQGKQGPELEQGRPVQEIMKEERETLEQAPEVIKDDITNSNGTAKTPTGTRHFSTYARRRLDMHNTADTNLPLHPSMLSTSTSISSSPTSPTPARPTPGHQYPLPTLPLAPNLVKTHREDPIVTQLTNLLMRHGLKAAAQRNMATILTQLRTNPAPTYSPTRPLLPGAPPATHLPLNPVLYLTLAVDSVAPLLRIRSQRGAAGGGMALQIPVPLGLRQRRRQAFTWILDAASKRQNRASGRDTFPTRVAQEITAVVEGRSGVWEKRHGVHRLGTLARTNLGFGRGPRRRF